MSAFLASLERLKNNARTTVLPPPVTRGRAISLSGAPAQACSKLHTSGGMAFCGAFLHTILPLRSTTSLNRLVGLACPAKPRDPATTRQLKPTKLTRQKRAVFIADISYWQTHRAAPLAPRG